MSKAERMSDKGIAALRQRVSFIQINAGPYVSDEMLERLIGVEQTLLSVSGHSNYLAHWLSSAEGEIRQAHTRRNKGGVCGCGVCK